MFSLNESLHYYLYPYYINMGCGIEILSELVRNTKTGNPLSGDVYLFCGKKRDMIKLLRPHYRHFPAHSFGGWLFD